jgi:hypothetical protein
VRDTVLTEFTTRQAFTPVKGAVQVTLTATGPMLPEAFTVRLFRDGVLVLPQYTGSARGAAVVADLEPGTYRVTVLEIHGCTSIPPQDVVVTANQLTTRAVPVHCTADEAE